MTIHAPTHQFERQSGRKGPGRVDNGKVSFLRYLVHAHNDVIPLNNILYFN